MSISDTIRILDVELPLALVIVVIIGVYGILFTAIRFSKEARRKRQEQVEHSELFDTEDRGPQRKHPMKANIPGKDHPPEQSSKPAERSRNIADSLKSQRTTKPISRKVVKMDFGQASPSPRSQGLSD